MVREVDNCRAAKNRHQEPSAGGERGHYFKAFAKILLLIALREKRPYESESLLAELAHAYHPSLYRRTGELTRRLRPAANTTRQAAEFISML